MLTRKWYLFALVGLVTTVAVVSFTSKQDKSTQGDTRNDRIVIGTIHDVDTFNPLFAESSLSREIIHLTSLGLADLDEHGEFRGELAESWEFSSDYKRLIYYLRRDARWSDGLPVTAFDVAFTYELLKDSTVASPNSWVCDFIEKVVPEDSFTVIFHFKQVYPDQIFDTAGEILPRHIFEMIPRDEIQSHAINRMPLANGPFMLEEWVPQQYIVLKPNPHYFGHPPRLKKVIFKVVPDKTNLLVQLQTGEVDMVMEIDPLQLEYIQQRNPELNFYPVSGRAYYYVGYNEKNVLFANRRVRQAITMAIDIPTLIRATMNGYGSVCTGPIPPILEWAYNNDIEPLPYDPKRSREILASLGWKDSDGDGWLDKAGKRFEFTIRTNAGNKIKEDCAVIIQEQLRKIGIKVNIETLEWANFQRKLRDKEFEAYIGGWNAALNVDPTPLFHSSATNLFNYVGYQNPEIDRLIERGRREMDRKRAAKIWRKFQEIIYQDQPYTFLFWLSKIAAVHSRFTNVTPNAISLFYGLENWQVKNRSSD